MKQTLLLIFLLVLLLPRASAQTGVIAGSVTDPDGKPISGATVRLFHSAVSEGYMPTTTTVTDAKGRFRAERLEYGKWTLECRAKGYYERYPTTGGWPSVRIPKHVLVTQGGSEDVTLVLRPNAVLYGQVTDVDGRPIVNQTIWLVAGPNNHGAPIHFRTTCDARGFYEREFEFGRESGLAVHVPGRKGYGPFTEFRLEDGKRTRVDFRLLRGATVSGRVFGPDGKTPVAGAGVSAGEPIPFVPGKSYSRLPPFRAHVHDRYGFSVEWEGEAVTAADGSFRLRVHPNVEHMLEAGTPQLRSHHELNPRVQLRDGEHRGGFRILVAPDPPLPRY